MTERSLPATGHFKELDSLRGLAALVVAIFHYQGSLAVSFQERFWPLDKTPLGIFLTGNESVLFFFVLSGFVLSLGFLDPQRRAGYGPYLLKRVLRLYPAYIASIAAAALLKHFLNQAPVPGFSAWFNHNWVLSSSWRIFTDHLPLITQFKAGRLNPPIWSLIVEMRLSLIFPLLVLAFLKFRWHVLWAAFLLALACACGTFGVDRDAKTLASVLRSLSFMTCFVAGIGLAYQRQTLKAKVSAFSRPAKWGLLCAGGVLYTAHFWLTRNLGLFGIGLPQKGEPGFVVYQFFVTNLLIVPGVCLFLALGLAAGSASRFLNQPVVHFFGKISYSLYLWHLPVLFGLAVTLQPYFPAGVVCLIAFAVSVGVATLSYYSIERPFIELGRRAARFLAPPSKRPLSQTEPSVSR